MLINITHLHVEVGMLFAKFAEELDVLSAVLLKLTNVLVHLLFSKSFESVAESAKSVRSTAVLISVSVCHFDIVSVSTFRLDDHASPIDAVLL